MLVQEDLFEIINDGNFVDARMIIDEGFDVNEVNSDHWKSPSIIFKACSITYIFRSNGPTPLEVVTFLADNGADLEITNRFGTTCFMSISHAYDQNNINGSTDLLEYLLKEGIRVNRRHQNGDTCLHNSFRRHDGKDVDILLKYGVIVRQNENCCSPILKAAFTPWVFPFPDEHIYKHPRPRFHRPSTDETYHSSPELILREKIDAYKLYGARAFQDEEVLAYWTKAFHVNGNRYISPIHYIHSRTCHACLEYSEETADGQQSTTPLDAWSAVKTAARIALTGKELLKSSRIHFTPMWMIEFIPSFCCPTCLPTDFVPSNTYPPVDKTKRFYAYNNTALQHLWADLQSTYSTRFRQVHQQSHQGVQRQASSSQIVGVAEVQIKNGWQTKMTTSYHAFRQRIKGQTIIESTSRADVVLGIEPICYVHIQPTTRLVDSHLHYLQHHWLLTGQFTAPRTKYKRSHEVCCVCGHIVVHFGTTYGVRPLAKVNQCLGCKHNRLTSCVNAVGRNYTRKGLPSKKNRVKITFCSNCGLITEEHPSLKKFKKATLELFGDAREIVTEDELKAIQDNRHALYLQKLLIILRVEHWTDPNTIRFCLFNVLDLPAFENVWSYVNASYEIFQRFSDFSTLLWELKQYSRREGNLYLDPALIMNSLKMLVDTFTVTNINTFTRLDQPFQRKTYSQLRAFIESIMFILNYYNYEIPVYINTRYFDEIFDNPIHEDGNTTHDITHGTTNTNQIEKGINERVKVSFTEEVRRMFLLQVRQVIHIDPKGSDGKSLIHNAFSVLRNTRDKLAASRGISVIKLFLQLGCDPNSRDDDGDTLVGLLLTYSEYTLQLKERLLTALFEGGAHMDAYKRSSRSKGKDEAWRHLISKYKICQVRNRQLTCLVAQAMNRYGLNTEHPRVQTYLPVGLRSFLDLHMEPAV